MDSFSHQFLSFAMNTPNSNHSSSPSPISPDSYQAHSLDRRFGQSLSPSSSPGNNDSFNATLKFINEVLLEEEQQQQQQQQLDLAQQHAPPHKSLFYPGDSSYPLLDQDSGYPQFQFQFNATSSTSPNGQRGKRNKHYGYQHQEEEEEEEGGRRRSKQLASYCGDYAPEEMFEKVLLWDSDNDDENSLAQMLQSLNQADGGDEKDEKVVDLMTLLNQCAQSVEANDHAASTKLLAKIRQQSSSTGDPTQRVAHYLANGLETRLTGDQIEPFVPIVTSGMSSADVLKAYQLHVTTCPFFRMSSCYANSAIRKLATTAPDIHIIDFGILYGFQWPGLIQRLSQRPGGPPKLRITGVELPQAGFRPAEKVEETKRRLQTYCERFNVPSEYNMIAKKWETVRYEDLNVREGEVVIVNCMNRMRHVSNDGSGGESPRDAVLRLIRRIRPELFIHGVVSGSCSGGPFLERFGEAVKHFSGLFDMMGATVEPDDPHGVMFQRAVYGRYAENVVGCEGPARVERPESYKEWEVRNRNAGFRQVGLDKEIFEAVKKTVAASYHKGYSVERDGEWLVQGWRGQRLYALSCWRPV